MIKTPQHVFSQINMLMKDHPGDLPFISDMSFSNFSDHSINQATEYFDPDLVEKGDTIYLVDWYIPWFVEQVHPKIKDSYILITNDSAGWHPHHGIWDYDSKNGSPPPVEATRTLLYDSKVAAWFSKNMFISRHPKLYQIPVGQNLILWGNFIDHSQLLKLSKDDQLKKNCLLYAAMQTPSHPSRTYVAKILETLPFCIKRVDCTIPRNQFYEEMSHAMFTVAPPGYGLDTVRFWEAIVLDCIPIVVHSELDDLYSNLPVLFIDDWTEIADESFLIEKFQEIKNKNISKEKSYFQYWADKISDIQCKVRENENGFSYLEATKFEPSTLKKLTTLFKSHNPALSYLICKGAAMTLRPFEMASECSFLSKIYVQDTWGAWGHENSEAHLSQYIDTPLSYEKKKIVPISFYDDITPLIKNHRNCAIFFDLSYLRHDLRKDLETYFLKSNTSTLFCGNMADDDYISSVLRQFSIKYGVKINYQNEVWFFKKTKRK